ncbi:reverse transcriptase zinc-binding domain-containing protein [Tanacetum coccineum]
MRDLGTHNAYYLEVAIAMYLNEKEKLIQKRHGKKISENQDNRRRDAWNSGNKDGSRTGKKEDSKALVTIDGEGVDWTSHSEEDEDYALMACNSSESDTEITHRDASIAIKAYSQGLKKVEAQLVAHQQGQLCYQKHKKEKEDLKAKVEKWHNSFKNLSKLLNTQMSANDKFGLGIRVCTAGGMHVVPLPMTGNYMPSGPDIKVDCSQFTYGPKQTQPSESESQSSEFDTCLSDAPIIEEYESDSEDEYVSIPTKQQETPSFVNQQVKTPMETVKNQFTHSQKPKVDKKELGYGFTARACFVCGSLNHLIRDCDFHDKMMAKKAELNNGLNRNYGQKEIRPIWNNVHRTNKQNQFVPSAVLTRTGKIPVNAAKASGTKNVSTARQSFNNQAVLTSTAMKVNTVKPIVNRVRPANVFHKTHSPSSRPFKKTTVLSTNFSKQKVNTAKVNAVSAVGGKRETAVKPSAGYNWRPQRYNWHNDYPHRALKNKGIVDSGCSRHMTGNKAYLAEFQDFNGDIDRHDSDYAGANLDRKSTTGGCQFLGRRLISWQCKKQTIVATSTTEAEYVAAASCWDAYEKKLIQVLKIHTDDNVADLLTKAFDVSRESLRRVFDGTEALLLPTLFILWLATVSTDSAKLVPLGKVCTAIETLKKNTARTTMAVLESCPKHNMVAYLEKTDGNAEFHDIIDFLTSSSIHHALTVSPVVSTTFVEQLWNLANVPVPLDHFLVNALTSKVFSFMVKKSKHFLGNVTPLFASMLVQPTEDEGANSERPSDALPTPSPPHSSEVPVEPQSDPSPTHTSEVPFEPQTDQSPRPSPSTTIPDSIPESSGRNLEGLSSSDKSLSGNEGEMTLQSVYDLCISLCTQVSDQAKEIRHLKEQIKKLKKQAKPIVKHHRAWMKSVSLKQRLARNRSSKKQWVHRESVSKQGRKFAKGEPSVHKDPLFDEIPEDSLDYMETEDAQDVGRTRDVVDEEKENDEDVLSTEDVLSIVQQRVSTDKEKVSTDRPIVSTAGSKVSTDRLKDSTDDQNEGTDEQAKGTDDHTEGGRATQTTQPPTSTIFRDDETIAQVLLNMSQAKAVSREKEKGVEIIKRQREEENRRRKDESESESNGIPEAEKKFKQLASDEEMANESQEEWKARIKADRLLAEKLQEEEREQFTIEERAKFLHDTIAAQRKFLAQQRSEAIRNRSPPPPRSTYKESTEKSNDDLLEAYEDFISIGSAEDERLIKKMNEKGIDSSNNEMVKEEDKEEEGTKKRKGGHIKMIARKKARKQSDVDSEDEHKKCLKIVTFESILDSEIMEKKSVIARLNKVSSPDGDYLVIYRANGNFRAFNYLMDVLHIFDRQDLFHLYDLIRDQFSEVTLDGFELILWGDLKIMMESSTEGNDIYFWSVQDWKIVHDIVCMNPCGVLHTEFEMASPRSNSSDLFSLGLTMNDVFVSVENDLDETFKQNELLKDRLLEASLAEDIKNLVITSCVEIRNKDLHDEIERISKESKDVSNESKTADTVCNDAFEVTQELSKRIVELEKDLSKFEAKSIAFEIALQHKSRENNSLKTVQKENENFMASLQLENAHLKQTYKDLFESVQRSKVETNQCDEVKVKDDFDEIETKNIELGYRVASLIKENEHLKLTYKNLFDSIKTSRIEFFKKKQLDISELNKGSGENICENAKCEFQTKFVELERVLTQQTKDFNDVKLELSKRTAKFEAYFEKLEKMKVVLERQLARKVDDSKAENDQFLKEINHLRTQLENLNGKSERKI